VDAGLFRATLHHTAVVTIADSAAAEGSAERVAPRFLGWEAPASIGSQNTLQKEKSLYECIPGGEVAFWMLGVSTYGVSELTSP
jgi:hypothetical protein